MERIFLDLMRTFAVSSESSHSRVVSATHYTRHPIYQPYSLSKCKNLPYLCLRHEQGRFLLLIIAKHSSQRLFVRELGLQRRYTMESLLIAKFFLNTDVHFLVVRVSFSHL